MAHVLLPCDVPSWPDVQKQLSQLKFAHSPEQLVADMQRIHDICCVGLDPEDISREEVSLDTLKKFLKISLTAEQRLRFFEVTLPFLISSALNLKQHKPEGGFLYSLQQQPGVFALDRQFINSLLANAFFSTFPKRNFKTHPTLQDFNFADLFQHLESPAHVEKLKKLLNYFYHALQGEPEGTVYFSRKVTPSGGLMSMPEWMCSDCPLCPLMVRTRGIMEDGEPSLLKTYPCSAKIGGDVLRDGNNMECSAFTNAPELLAALVFVESLGDNEALTVDGILPMEHRPQAGDEPSLSPYESSVALLDFKDHTFKPVVQFEDSSLLRELNKCLLAFRQNIDSRRPSPVGQSSSSSAGLDGGFQSLPSSINSSSQNSIYVTDSADQQSDDAGPENKEHKPPQQATTTLCHRAKKVVKADPEARPARQPTDENKTVKTVFDALKQATQVVTLKQSSTAEPAPAVMNATSLPPPSEKVPNCCQKTTVPELPVLRKSSRRSFNSSSSKGSFEERRRSYEKILSALPPPAAASPPLLTQAVLCAQRHPSPRPERRGSGATGQSGMVFRPVTPSPTGSRRSSFRPLLESMPVLDPRKESHELPCRGPIPLPDCTFSSLITKNICSTQPSTVPLYALLQEKHTLSSSPVSSPRFRSSFGYSEDEPDRPVSLDLPVSKASRPDVPENVDIPQSSPLTSPATNGGRGSLSGSSTPYGSPEAELWPRMYRQKTTEDEHDFRTAEESFSEGTDDRQHSPVRVKQRFLRTRRQRSFRAQTSGSSFQSSARLSRDDSASSAGFVLDYRSDDDDCGVSSLSKHERYEDFRRRIKRRTRRLARRASRGSRMSYSSGSSEMDDIYEDPELGFSPRMQRPIRAANSEPTLFSETRDSTRHEGFPPLSLASEVVITSSPGRRQMLMMTTRLGLPKAYSFDGVNPNLPVPFKAKFRCRKPAGVDSDPECLGLTRHDADFIRNFALPPPSPEAVGTSSGKEDTDESRGQATGKPLSQAEEPAEAEQKDTTVCSEPSPFLKPSASGVRPVATCRWSRDGSGSADVQLEAIIQWLAASMARVPCFVVYTGGEPKLEQLPQVGYKAEERHWTVGDLACETLRYCRNRLAIQQGRYKGKMSRDTTLFSLLIGHTGKFQSHDSLD